MNTFLYIFGFFLLSAGTTTSFLLDISAAWEEWGNWRCRVGDNGTCRMFRTRKCSTGTSTDCGTDSLMTRSCAPSVCPDKVKLEQSGQCQDYVSEGQTCADDSTCGIITDPFHPICLDRHVSHDICPKACGCCEELPHWLEWSAWKCHLAPNHTCEMHRTRNCSTTSLDDCVGKSAMKANCSNTVCPELVNLSKQVDCSVVDTKATKCVDGPGCSAFKTDFLLNLLCSDPITVAECPLTCGCCVAELPHWLEWSAWECNLAPNHTCEMHRTRNCSTGSLDDCVGISAMTASCTDTVCRDVMILSSKTDCSAFDYLATKCIDHRGCEEFKTILALDVICSEPATAAACPVICGCCTELPYWLEWSAWECNLAPNHTCEMHRTRNCSTGSLDDCVGISAMTASCTDTVCPDVMILSSKTDCSAFDYQATKCIDHGRGCFEFNTLLALDVICSEPTTAAECPVTCGCCTNSSSVTTTGTPVDPISWSPWECHHRRGHCVMRRHRICKSALGLEMACVDNLYERKECDESCKVNGQWADWQEWSKCSHSCSGGTRTRVRSCTNPVPSSGGKYCDGYGNMTEICNSSDCPEWSQWLYTACSVTCGNGTSTRLRLCSSGRELDCGPGKGQETVVCHETPCPINGQWADWQEWSKCSHSCSGGIRTRVRTCTNPPPAFGGKDCTGNGTMTENCQRATCPEWSQWLYAACSVSCGSGTRTRLRVCSSGNDLDCGPGKAHDSVACNEGPCPST